MCGIAGYIEFNGNAVSSRGPYKVINEMLDTIEHRGPDDYGISLYGYSIDENTKTNEHVNVYESNECRTAYGMKRLSILDLSIKGRQPMQSHDGTIEIVFNGEIYNYLELREELKDKCKFETGSDTEVLIEAYRQWGTEMLNKLDGMFAFFIMDKKKKIFVCARDPIGIKPFYYNYTKEYFIFGSEPKVVLKARNTNGSVDAAHSSEFLITGISDHDGGTFYNEVKQLMGGHYMEISFEGRSAGPQKYWRAPNEIMPDKDYSTETYENMLLSVKRQMRADVTVGTSLSGGIDSGAIVTLAGEILKSNSSHYNTLTFTHPGFKNDESENAKIIADNSGMKWHRVTPDLNTLGTDVQNMMINMGEPFSTLSMFAQYKVMEEAHKLGIKVMLDGQGGDELYLGYPRVAQRVLTEYMKRMNFAKVLKELSGLSKNASVSYSRSILGNLFFSTPSIALKRSRDRMNSYISGDLMNSYRKDVVTDLYSGKNIFDIQIDELTKYNLPRLLKYADRNSMAFSVESRVPHLSKIMLDYSLKLPLNWRVRDGWTKYAIRKAMEGRMPDKILWANEKKGFDIPQKLWVEKLNGNISSWLSSSSAKNCINTDNILKAIEEGKGGEQHLWRAISFGSWINLMDVSS